MEYKNIMAKKSLDKKKSMSSVFNMKTSSYNIGDIRVFPIVVDMDKVEPIITPYKFKQYDFGTSYLDIQIMDGDVSVDLAGANIVGAFKHKTGNVVLDVAKSKANILLVNEGVVRVLIPNEILKKTGTVNCEIMLFNEVAGRSTSPSISFSIESSLFDHESASSDIQQADNYPVLVSLMNDVSKLHSDTNKIMSESVSLNENFTTNENKRINQELGRVSSMSNMKTEHSNNVIQITNKISEMNSKILECNDTIDDVTRRFNSLSPEEATNSEVQLARTDISGFEHASLSDRLNELERQPSLIYEEVEG